MKKLLFLAAFAVFGLTVNAQEKTTKSDVKKATDAVEKEATKLYNQAKTGGFKAGVNIGLPIGDANDYTSFNIGLDIAYLFEVADNLEVGALAGYTHFFGKDIKFDFDGGDLAKSSSNTIKFDDVSFMPIAATGRYYFSDRKMYAGLDLGYAINVAGDNVDGGLYFRPKFGYNLGKVNLVGSYQYIGGDVVNFSSINAGVEIAF